MTGTTAGERLPTHSIVTRSATGLRSVVLPMLVGMLGASFAGYAISIEVGSREHRAWWVAGHMQVVGIVFLAVGLFVWLRQPDGARMGALLVAIGITWYMGDLQFSGNPLLFNLGFWLFHLNAVVLAHFFLAYPDGRLSRRPERIIIALLYTTTLTTQGLRLLTERPLRAQGWGKRDNLSIWAPIAGVLGITLTLCVLVLVIQRWRAESEPARRARGLFWAATVFIGMVTATALMANLLNAPSSVESVLLLLYSVALILLGTAVLIGALRMHMAHKRVTQLLTRIEPLTGGTVALREALAEALEDPSLAVHYWRADSDEYVNSHGISAPLPTGDDRAVTLLVGPEEQPLAALVHDKFLVHQRNYRQRLEAVAVAARLALENARLNAENLAHLRGILEIETATRYRIRAMLHDGPQHRLSGIQLLVGQLRRQHGGQVYTELEQISAELQETVQDLRDVTEDVYPAVLQTKGLEDALDSLAQRSQIPIVLDISPGRWPGQLEETVFFLISEAIGNVHKHAKATRITVRVQKNPGQLVMEVSDDGDGGARASMHGSGLRGMRDRVAAHEGHLVINSPPGGGTTIRAVLPCA